MDSMFVQWMKDAESAYSQALSDAYQSKTEWASLQEALETRLAYEFKVVGVVSLIAAWAGQPCACESFKCEAAQ